MNGKRTGIDIKDLETIADRYTIKNFKGIVMEIQTSVDYWIQVAKENNQTTKENAGHCLAS